MSPKSKHAWTLEDYEAVLLVFLGGVGIYFVTLLLKAA
jgi:hypothetical protein